MNKKSENKNLGFDHHTSDSIVRFCGMAIFLISAFIFSYLAYQSARISMYSSNKYTGYNWPVEISDSVFKNIIFCLFALCVLIGLYLFENKYPHISEIICRITLITVLTLYMILGIRYVLTSPYYPSGDQLSATAGAAYALEGNFLMFQKLGYIGIWPHLKGLLLFYEIIFKLFGSFNYTASGIINLILNALTILTGYFLIKDFNCSALPRFLWLMLSAFMFPYFIMIPYAYGDLPSIFGIMVFVFFFKKYISSKKIHSLFLAALGSAFAIESRGSAWIAVIALFIASVLISIQKKKIYPLIGILAISIFCYSCNMLIGIGFEKASGYDRHTGSPVYGHIAMGMQETDGSPGVFNRYNQTVYEGNDGDRAAAAAEAKEYISERLAEFRCDKELAKDFYKKKILLQWIEPMFESNTHMASFKNDISLQDLSPFYMRAYVGDIHIFLFKFMNKYQSLCYLLCLIYCVLTLALLIQNKKEPDIYMWFFFIFFIGGFIFSIIWEAKARYQLPYFIFMLPTCSLLITDAAAFLKFGNILKVKGHQQSL